MNNQLLYANNLYLWCETFGDRDNLPILLIAGSGAQCLLWPEQFCQNLADKGFYVIRYDHRDTGCSSNINFEQNPYDLDALAQDAIGILNALNISKASVIGSSMGGYVAQLLATHYPDRVLNLTLLMTSLYSYSLQHAFIETEDNPFPLPLPSEIFREALLEIRPAEQTRQGQVNHLLSIWSAYNGQASAINQNYWTNLAENWITRTKDITFSYNHTFAVARSEDSREHALKQLKHSTLIIHGELDPFFSIEHAQALKNAIPYSKLHIIPEMGHLLQPKFSEILLSLTLSHLLLGSKTEQNC